MSTETLEFKIGLSGTYWNKRPAYSILLNNKKVLEGSISEESNEVEYVTFTADLEENTKHTQYNCNNIHPLFWHHYRKIF